MIKKFLLALAILLGLAAPLPAFAATDPYKDLSCGVANDTAVCQGKSNTANPITGPQGIVLKATNVVAFVAGIAAILFIVFSGIKYITSSGDPQEVSKAKQSIIYAAVGLVAIALARQLISFVVSKV